MVDKEIDLGKERDELFKLRTRLAKAKLGCGEKDYNAENVIGGEYCEEGKLCDKCEYNVNVLERDINDKTLMMALVNTAREVKKIEKIRDTLSNSTSDHDQLAAIKEILGGEHS